MTYDTMSHMSSDAEKFHAAITAFDAANAQDPTQIAGVPAELLYSRRMTDWLNRLYPDAGELLHLAARSQHIRRWMVPRSKYPMTRPGYHQWRTYLYSFHADTAAEIMKQAGYDDPAIARVRSLLKKEKLKSDPETQMLEDVVCLVFLESYFADFAARHDDQKIIGILRKTWAKMSHTGQAAALTLKLSSVAQRLVKAALDGTS